MPSEKKPASRRAAKTSPPPEKPKTKTRAQSAPEEAPKAATKSAAKVAPPAKAKAAPKVAAKTSTAKAKPAPKAAAKTATAKAPAKRGRRRDPEIVLPTAAEVASLIADLDQETPNPVLPVVPLRGLVAFPAMVLPLFIGRPKSIEAVQAAANGDKLLFLVAQKDEEKEEPEADDLFQTGIVAEIAQWLRLPDGNLRVVVEGRGRARSEEYLESDNSLSARVKPVEETEEPTDAASEALRRHLRDNFENAVNLSKKIPPEALQNAQESNELGGLGDLIASYLEIGVPERQAILEEGDVVERGRMVAELLTREIQVLELDREIEAQVKEGLSDNQREFFLRERLKTIQEKLGERDPNFRDAEGLRDRVEAANMPPEAKEKAIYELDRLERMPPIAPEVGMIRNYVELM